MKTGYFTKIVILMQAVGKVLFYCMVTCRLTLTYKVTILFGKLINLFRCSINHCLHHFGNLFSLSLSLALVLVFCRDFSRLQIYAQIFLRDHSHNQIVAFVYFSLQFFETIDLESFLCPAEEDRTQQLREFFFG